MIRTFQTQTSLSRDFALLSVFILFLLSLISLWVAYETYEGHAEKTLSLLENETVRIDRALIIEIKNASYLLESLGRQISQRGPEKLDSTARLLRSFNNDARQDDTFFWINDTQHVVASSTQDILSKPVDVSDRDYVKRSLAEPWKTQIGRPVLGRVSEKWVLPVAMGLTDFNGKHVGIIAVSIDINALTKGLRNEVRESGLHFAILSKTLSPLTEVSDDSNYHDDLLPTQALTNINFDTKPSAVISRASLFNPNNNYALYEMSSKYPYVILIGYDSSLSTTEVMELLLPRLAVVAINAIFLFLVLTFVRSRIIHPVEALSERAVNIARGQKYVPLRENVPYEIDQLAEQLQKIDLYIQERLLSEDELLVKNTYLRRVKETAQKMNRARTQLMTSLAEEIEKPAEAIQEYAESIKDQHFGAIGNDDYLKHAFEIYHLSSELTQMTADMRSVSELEEGILVLHEKPVDISFVLHRAIRLFQEQPRYRHIEVKLRMDDDLPKLIIDEERFNQVMVNMFSAATTHLASGGAITLECMLDKDEHGQDIYTLMMKYPLTEPGEEQSDAEYLRRLQLTSEQDRKRPFFITSEAINLTLAHMLITLHEGDLEIETSQNNVRRIYIRFPESRIRLFRKRSFR